MKRFDCQQRVIDTAKSGPPDDNHRKPQSDDQIHDIGVRRDRHINPSDSFDDHIVIAGREKTVDLADHFRVDDASFGLGRRKWRHRRSKLKRTDGPERILALNDGLQSCCIRLSHPGLRDPGFDRLHHADSEAAFFQMEGKRRRHERLTDCRVGSRDKHSCAGHGLTFSHQRFRLSQFQTWPETSFI